MLVKYKDKKIKRTEIQSFSSGVLMLKKSLGLNWSKLSSLFIIT